MHSMAASAASRSRLEGATCATGSRRVRVGTAARNVKDAGLPKIVAGKLKQDAQESAARAEDVHAKRIDDARQRLDDAERAIRDDEALMLDLPDTEVPAG